MTTSNAIRIVDGIEVPAVGCWPIGPGHKLTLEWTRRVRRNRTTSRVIDGYLQMLDEPAGSSLELQLHAPDALECTCITVVARVVVADASGAWTVRGTAASGSLTADVHGSVHYLGVFRNGDRTTAWLAVDLTLGPFSGPSPDRRLPRTIRIAGDLNAGAPVPLGRSLAGCR